MRDPGNEVDEAGLFHAYRIEYRSVTSYKMKFVKLWDLLRYSERTTSKTPTRQKLAIWGRLSLRQLRYFCYFFNR